MKQAFRRRSVSLLFVAALSLSLLGAGDADPARFAKVGHRLMCPCGCAQMLLECNHVGCPDSDTMRAQLAAGVSKGDSDDSILSGFVETYGATVLAAPTKKGFDLVAWIMPFVALLLGVIGTAYVARRWHNDDGVTSSATSGDGGTGSGTRFDELRRRAREETDL
jgi:cytochrome c-type biogenesis protein CcmH